MYKIDIILTRISLKFSLRSSNIHNCHSKSEKDHSPQCNISSHYISGYRLFDFPE